MTTPQALSLVAAILDGAPALPRALCRGLAPSFDVVNPLDAAVPIAACRNCPERTPCSMWARAAQLTGVAGGRVYNPRQPQQRELSA